MAWVRASYAALVQVTAGSGRSQPSMKRIGAAGSKRRPTGRSGNSCAPARRYRTIEILVGAYTLTAADPLPGDVNALSSIHQHSSAH